MSSGGGGPAEELPVQGVTSNSGSGAGAGGGAAAADSDPFPAYNPRDFEDNGGEVGADECCMCNKRWQPGLDGWPLCDSNGCSNVVCNECTAMMSLLVSDLFYCPECAGSGVSAAALAGGAIASAVKACSELVPFPRTLRAPSRKLAAAASSAPASASSAAAPPPSGVLVCGGFLDTEHILKLIEVLDSFVNVPLDNANNGGAAAAALSGGGGGGGGGARDSGGVDAAAGQTAPMPAAAATPANNSITGTTRQAEEELRERAKGKRRRVDPINDDRD
eukprot:gene8272-15118_t